MTSILGRDLTKFSNTVGVIFEMMKYRGYTHYKLIYSEDIFSEIRPKDNSEGDVLEETKGTKISDEHTLQELFPEPLKNVYEIRSKLSIYFYISKGGERVKTKGLQPHMFLFSEWIKVGVSEMQILAERAIDRFRKFNKDDDIIVSLVLQDTLTPTATKILNILPMSMNITINLFTEAELQINVTKHEKVDMIHEVCSKKEKEEIMTGYSVNGSQLPHMFINEPIIKFMGAKKGDLIKIHRKSETWKDSETGKQYTSLYYRLIV